MPPDVIIDIDLKMLQMKLLGLVIYSLKKLNWTIFFNFELINFYQI